MTQTRIYRIGRLGCGALALSLASQAAVAQTAYFSLEGDLNVLNDSNDFFFDLTRSVGSGEDLRFLTYNQAGGTNEAGDIIAAGPIDPDIELFDSLNASHGRDDASGPGLDALLTWGVGTIAPLNPDPLAADSYRLHLIEFGVPQIGPWALDLIGPDDAMVFTGAASNASASIDSLKFGSNDGGTAVYNHSSGTFDLLGELVVAQTGNANLNLSGGTITAGGLTTVNVGGILTQAGGTLNANGGVLVDGGTANLQAGGFNLGAGQALTASNAGQVNITGGYNIGNGSTFTIDTGADLTGSFFIDVGNGSDGTLLVDGPGSQVMVNDATYLGDDGATADVTIRNQAVYDANTNRIEIGRSSAANTHAIVRVQTGASFSAGTLRLGADGSAGGSAQLDLSGTGSSITQTGAVPFTIGHATDGSATFNVQGGTFTSGTSTTIVNASGAVNHAGGTYIANGDLTLNGGQFVHTAGVFTQASGTTLTVQNGGQFEWNDDELYLDDAGSSILVTGVGSVFRQTDAVGIDSTIFVQNGVDVDVTLGGTLEAEYLFVESGSSVTVDGAGSTLDVTAGNSAFFVHIIGRTSGTSSLTLSNNATGTFASALPTYLSVGQTAAGTADVLSGADLTVQELRISPFTTAAGTGTVTVDGSGSTITQTAGSALDIGSASGSTGTLNVQNAGVFNASNTGVININATGGLNADSGTFNANWSGASIHAGTINTSGDVNVTGSGLVSLVGLARGVFPDSGPGGNGGTVNVLAGTVDLSGTGRLRANGGRGADFSGANNGGAGGAVAISGGALTAVDSSQVLLSGGDGGKSGGTSTSGLGGAGGTITVSAGSLSLNDTALLQLDGGNSLSTHSNPNRGGHGGTIDVTGGAVTVNNNTTVSLDGGNGSAAIFSGTGGNAGNGGQVLVSSGSFTVNGGEVALRRGNPGSGPGGLGAQGVHGTIDVTGGTFTMNGGEAFTGSFARSGLGFFNHNDGKLTVSGGTFDPGSVNHTITSPALVELPTLVLTDGATAPGVTGTFTVGDSTRGRLEILNGATLASTEVRIGNSGGGSGQALVNGIGSTWTSAGGNAYVVGEGGAGELTVSNGGAVSTSDFLVVGRLSTGDGTVHINSGGSVDATNPAQRMIIGEFGTAVVNVGAGGSLSSADRLDIGALSNADGTLNVDGAGALVNANADLYVGGSSFGSGGTGLLNVANGAQVNVTGTLTNYAGGTLRGNGTINASSDLLNRGTVILDSEYSGFFNDLEIVGDYTQDSTGRVVISPVTGDATVLDQLDITNGLMTLAGELAFDPLADYSNILQYDTAIGPILNGQGSTTRTGTFDTVTGADLGDGTGLTIIYGSNFVNALRAILGDLNLDGFVGIDDLNIVLGNWNQNVDAGVWGAGDPSGDGFIGIDDLNTVLGNWNAGTPPPPIGQANIPEPGMASLMGLGVAVLLRRRRV